MPQCHNSCSKLTNSCKNSISIIETKTKEYSFNVGLRDKKYKLIFQSQAKKNLVNSHKISLNEKNYIGKKGSFKKEEKKGKIMLDIARSSHG